MQVLRERFSQNEIELHELLESLDQAIEHLLPTRHSLALAEGRERMLGAADIDFVVGIQIDLQCSSERKCWVEEHALKKKVERVGLKARNTILFIIASNPSMCVAMTPFCC